jgi:hypothetical protein
VLNSPGGSALAGIEIGKAIRLKGLATVVPESSICASACAIAWLGGTPRFMSRGARVGFHAAFDKTNGEASSAANAAVGAFLNQLGLRTDAIFYITSAAPSEIQWLSFEDAEKLGIEVKPFETAEADGTTSNNGAPSPAVGTVGTNSGGEWIQLASRTNLAEAIQVAMNVRASGQSPLVFRYDNGWFVVVIGPFPRGTAASLRDRLIRTASIPDDSLVTTGTHYVEVVWGGPAGAAAPSDGTAEALSAARAFFTTWSGSNGEALSYLSGLYPDRLMYYGKLSTKNEVMEDKADFVARWPERSYSIEPGSITVGCRPDGSCLVSGLVNWRAHSRKLNRTSIGTARFDLVFTGPGASQLVAESGQVLDRKRYSGH